MCPGSVYPPEVSCQWLSGLNGSRFQHSYCAHCAIGHFLASLLFCAAPLTVAVLWQEKNYIQPGLRCVCIVSSGRIQTDRREIERVGQGLKECFGYERKQLASLLCFLKACIMKSTVHTVFLLQHYGLLFSNSLPF